MTNWSTSDEMKTLVTLFEEHLEPLLSIRQVQGVVLFLDLWILHKPALRCTAQTEDDVGAEYP